MRRFLLAPAMLAASLPLLATEPNPSARQRELVLKLLDVTNASRTGSNLMDALFGQVEKQFFESAQAKGNRPEDLAEAREMFLLFREKAAKIDVAAVMQEAYIRIYSKYFTEPELEALIAFHSTPVGKKSIEVMPDLFREGMEAGVRELTPKIERVMAEVEAEREKKRPWRRTMTDIQSVAAALEAYASDHEDLYPTGDYASLESMLTPTYLKELPKKDSWGHVYAYAVSPDRRHYRIVSAGADAIFDWDSRRIATREPGPVIYRERLEDDIILDDLGFVQLPVQAKEAEEEE